jgi:hypothetical protein
MGHSFDVQGLSHSWLSRCFRDTPPTCFQRRVDFARTQFDAAAACTQCLVFDDSPVAVRELIA